MKLEDRIHALMHSEMYKTDYENLIQRRYKRIVKVKNKGIDDGMEKQKTFCKKYKLEEPINPYQPSDAESYLMKYGVAVHVTTWAKMIALIGGQLKATIDLNRPLDKIFKEIGLYQVEYRKQPSKETLDKLHEKLKPVATLQKEMSRKNRDRLTLLDPFEIYRMHYEGKTLKEITIDKFGNNKDTYLANYRTVHRALVKASQIIKKVEAEALTSDT